ncbi:BcepNY3gp35 [Burkholderia phage BcepNY3]|uniref:Gp37 n=2 Tax=Naesvirus TaxID=2733115 RepID=Q6UIZ4_9CAUD|nr:gp37 [Burkholderia phage Bcep1]YP_001294873.1 BcepNY3gp35 [Burkholderia phage BcepNY3]AAQ73384.1 gp37 [Burkholderia phage Bcep1]ABR10570.1 BcepNY3gp35 [Burkholderia phage BcepNY3]
MTPTPLSALQPSAITTDGSDVINVRGELFRIRVAQILSSTGFRIDGAVRATYCLTFDEAVAWMS